MGTHKLQDWEMDDEPFVLIAIHSTVEPYRMAYLINKYLKVSFKRQLLDLDITQQDCVAQYPLYFYRDNNENASIYLIPNHSRALVNSTNSAGGLFEAEHTEIKTVLIKEYKTVDFFLKIEKDPDYFPLKKMLNRINEIPQVISVYPADVISIKHTDYLIFE